MFKIDFDMILGMVFLRKNTTKIDCRCKKVQFSLENRVLFEFGERYIMTLMISALKARKF